MAVDPDMARLLLEREGDKPECVEERLYVGQPGSSVELRSQPVVVFEVL